jgi:predicted nucleotidyltransferase
MNSKKDALTALFPGTLRKKLLVQTFLHPDEDLHVGALVRLLNVSRGALARELADMTEAEILQQSRRGNQVLYRANREAPFFKELRGLIQKTAGAIPALKEAVHAVADEVDFAFLFGSVAKGEDRSDSDMDLMLIGDRVTGRVKAELKVTMKDFGRALDIQEFTVDQYCELLEQGSPFLVDVINGPIIMLSGEKDDLKNTGTIRASRRHQTGAARQEEGSRLA